MTAANDNTVTRTLPSRIVPIGIIALWAGSFLLALAADSGLFR